MRVLVALLLVGIAGCGGGAVPTPEGSQGKTDKPPAQTAAADPVAALKKLGANIERNEQGEVVEVILRLSKKSTFAGRTMHRHQSTKITDAGLVHLKGLANLQTLILWSTKVTDAGLVYLKGLTKMQTLDLRGTKFTDAGLVHLKGMTSLQRLSLSNTKVTDAGLVHLRGMTKLQRLIIMFTQITDGGLVHLKGLTNLQTLNLGRTQITDAGLVHLKGLTSLQTLDLRVSQITDTGLVHLKGLGNLNPRVGPLVPTLVASVRDLELPNEMTSVADDTENQNGVPYTVALSQY